MRFLRGFAALVVLVVGLVGVPWALLRLGGNPFPSSLTGSAVVRALFRPDDGTVLIGLITVIGWLAWLVFALTVLAELVTTLSRQRIRVRLPGLGGAQRAVGVLVVLVVAMLVLPQPRGQAGPVTPSAPVITPGSTSSARPTPGPVPPTTEATRAGDNRPAAAQGTGPRAGERVHVVRPGDDLWSLAEHYYGHGPDWRRIAAANPHLLSGGPDRLETGWRLVIPGATAGTTAGPGAESPRRVVVVRAGETLSSIAEREYGHSSAWVGLFRANRELIDDPDVIDVELRLEAPAELHTASGRFTRRSSENHRVAATERGEAAHRSSQQGESRAESQAESRAEGDGAPSGETADTTAARAAEQREHAEQRERAEQRTDEAPAGPATSEPSDPSASAEENRSELAAPVLAGVGGLLAAGLLTALAVRRRMQLQVRPVGRRIAQPPAPAQQLETRLGRTQTPLDLEALDLALRAVGLAARQQDRPMPQLQAAEVADDQIEFVFTEPVPDPPLGFTASGQRWRMAASDLGYLRGIPGVRDAAQPYPALVALGTRASASSDQRESTDPRPSAGRQLLINLEAIGLLGLDLPSGRDAGGAEPDARAVLAALVAQLALTPWSDELIVSLVGPPSRFVEALDRPTIGTVEDLDALLERWEQRARAQRAHLGHDDVARRQRLDPDLADPWTPEIAVVTTEVDDEQLARLERLLLVEPPVTLAAVLTRAAPGGWTLRPEQGDRLRLAELDWTFTPQQLSDELAASIVELLAATGTDQTTPAPWWPDEQTDQGPLDETDLPPTVPERPAPRRAWPSSPVRSPEAAGPLDHRLGPTATAADLADGVTNVTSIGVYSARRWASEESATVSPSTAATGPSDVSPPVRHPTLRLLGPIELLGATGPVPARAAKQCIEYCAWLLEHPASTAQAMATGLAVAEGTRRSNMSRLRAWLGEDSNAKPYLPDAYSGRIMLSAVVSSDWHLLQILTSRGVPATGTEGLTRALELVRGAPLADAAPGQWHWAEEMRTDMASVIRDIGVELSRRALADGDLDLARWAAARGLTANPHDEQLMAARIRVEHRAGHVGETERLALEISAHARLLGIDLDPQTVDLLQQVLEGQLRARA